MNDHFEDKAHDWDERPIPQQISEGLASSLKTRVDLHPGMEVLDFGAGTGLVAAKVASAVGSIIAVDVSQSMLDQLAQKPELAGKARIVCQDILEQPLEAKVDLIVSAMALHHVEDTAQLARTFFDHLKPGGHIALADLDAEDGDFHPPGTEGVYHAGFERAALGRILSEVGFEGVEFTTACEVDREQRRYSIFFVTAQRPVS